MSSDDAARKALLELYKEAHIRYGPNWDIIADGAADIVGALEEKQFSVEDIFWCSVDLTNQLIQFEREKRRDSQTGKTQIGFQNQPSPEYQPKGYPRETPREFRKDYLQVQVPPTNLTESRGGSQEPPQESQRSLGLPMWRILYWVCPKCFRRLLLAKGGRPCWRCAD